MTDIIIFGGFNWLGYEIVNEFVKSRYIKNFIIVDSFSRFLERENIKEKFDEYRHLYGEDLHLFNVNIKDKEQLEEIYNRFNIQYCILNVKYNIYDSNSQIKDKFIGYNNIKCLNNDFNVKKILCIMRKISHNQFCLNNMNKDIVSMNQIFNNNMVDVFSNSYKLWIRDYLHGNKKDKTYNDIHHKVKTIIKSGSPIFYHNCDIYLTKDEELLDSVFTFIHFDERKSIVVYEKTSYENIFNHYLKK
jgi:hypothetical protein